MKKKLLPAAVVAALSAAAVLAFAAGGAGGATAGTASISIPAMLVVPASSHNSFATHACAAQVTSSQGSENQGVSVNYQGGALQSVLLPQGATVTGLRLVGRDNDTDVDTHAFLNRKQLGTYSGYLGRYQTMASVKSAGARDRVRTFTQTTVTNPVVDNNLYAYVVEVVNCSTTLDPIAVQVDYTTP